jgi:hypothetical protein
MKYLVKKGTKCLLRKENDEDRGHITTRNIIFECFSRESGHTISFREGNYEMVIAKYDVTWIDDKHINRNGCTIEKQTYQCTNYKGK